MRGLRSGAAGLVVTAAALLLAACGSSPSTSSSGTTTTTTSSSTQNSGAGATQGATSITISNFMFSPMSVSVSPGATISVTNKDSSTHTLTSTTAGQFDTGDIAQNQTKTFKAPMKPGTYSYICNIHQYMMGTITVK